MRYVLNVRCEIQQTDDQRNYYGQGLNVEETVEVHAGSFLEIAAIFGRFHDLSEDVKRLQGAESPQP